MQKKIFFLGNFYFITKKSLLFLFFLDFLRPAFGHGRLGHPGVFFTVCVKYVDKKLTMIISNNFLFIKYKNVKGLLSSIQWNFFLNHLQKKNAPEACISSVKIDHLC